MEWQPPETAPKDGTVFIGVFGDISPTPVQTCWSLASKKWCASIQQADMFNGRWDMFFENEWSLMLLKWLPMPEVEG